MTYILSTHFNAAVQTYNNISLNILLQSVMVYIYIKDKYSISKNVDNKFINLISNLSLGIYAIHACIIDIVYMLLGTLGISSSIVGIPLLFFISFGTSSFISFMMNKINVLKKIVS